MGHFIFVKFKSTLLDVTLFSRTPKWHDERATINTLKDENKRDQGVDGRETLGNAIRQKVKRQEDFLDTRTATDDSFARCMKRT